MKGGRKTGKERKGRQRHCEEEGVGREGRVRKIKRKRSSPRSSLPWFSPPTTPFSFDSICLSVSLSLLTFLRPYSSHLLPHSLPTYLWYSSTSMHVSLPCVPSLSPSLFPLVYVFFLFPFYSFLPLFLPHYPSVLSLPLFPLTPAIT